jgi:hypothetical protein
MRLMTAVMMVLLVAGCCHGSHEQQPVVTTIKEIQLEEPQVRELGVQELDGVKMRIRTLETIRPNGTKVINFKAEILP